MSMLTVRDLDPEVKEKLRRRAASRRADAGPA
jgi:plasmid stability protein